MATIEVRDLAKSYGKTQALQGVTLAVEAGEVYGLLGQNGAGKTTLVKICLSIVHATGGKATLLGRDDFLEHQRIDEGFADPTKLGPVFASVQGRDSLPRKR